MPFPPKAAIALAVIMAPLSAVTALADTACLPVTGTVTSAFGSRFHPVLRQARQYDGVSWSAPADAVVIAAMDGTVTAIETVGQKGAMIQLDHGGDLQTRYSSLGAMSEAVQVGDTMRAGDRIGVVGSRTDTQTGSLHFQVLRAGLPVNPFESTIEAPYVDKIAEHLLAAKPANPLSSQSFGFIESTWLRLTRDHRPDLHQSMSRADILALRADPKLNKDMMVALLQENAQILEEQGHSVAAPELYLSHFVGVEAALNVLNADADETVPSVLGQGFVRANPSFASYSIAEFNIWLDQRVGALAVEQAKPNPAIAPAVLSWSDAC